MGYAKRQLKDVQTRRRMAAFMQGGDGGVEIHEPFDEDDDDDDEEDDDDDDDEDDDGGDANDAVSSLLLSH